MAYVSTNYDKNPAAPMGTWVGPAGYFGECVSYVKAVTPGLPQTKKWKKGRKVKGDKTVAKGTVIATFNAQGAFEGHAAIYENQTQKGINVVDQWISKPAKAIGRRMLVFGGKGNSNNGDKFFVVD